MEEDTERSLGNVQDVTEKPYAKHRFEAPRQPTEHYGSWQSSNTRCLNLSDRVRMEGEQTPPPKQNLRAFVTKPWTTPVFVALWSHSPLLVRFDFSVGPPSFLGEHQELGKVAQENQELRESLRQMQEQVKTLQGQFETILKTKFAD